MKYHQLTLQANNDDLWLHNHQQNKLKKKKKNNIHSGGRWDLISSAGEPEIG